MVDRTLEYTLAGRRAAVGDVSLQSLAERVVRELRDNGTLGGARVTVHDGLPTVRNDLMVISRVPENLVGNAAKYRRPDVEPVVEIGSAAWGGEIAVFVRDNGLGIRREDLGRIFDPLVQTENAASRPAHGLGLAIAKRCVEGWRGRVWAESEHGKGSTFCFMLTS